ncbi:MAG: PorV/PorQ family protein [bacterium]
MLKKFTYMLVTVLVMFALVVETFAGGGRRNGTGGAQELLLPVSARGLSLSGSYVSGMTGLDAMYYNPAGLGVSENTAEAMFSYMNYIADIGFVYAAAAVHFDDFGSLGFSVRSVDFGEMDETTVESPYGTGVTFSPTYVVLGVTYSNALTDRIRVGININLISEKILRTSASGMAFDAGIQYNGLAGVEGLKFGITLRNLGPQMSFDGPDLIRTAEEADADRGPNFYMIDAAAFELPSQMEIGLAYEAKFSDSYSALITTSFQNNNFSNDEYRVGGEFSYNDLFFVRAGYTHVSEATGDGNEDQYLFGPTFGAGLNLSSTGANVIIDYAYRAANYFDANQMITVKLGF